MDQWILNRITDYNKAMYFVLDKIIDCESLKGSALYYQKKDRVGKEYKEIYNYFSDNNFMKFFVEPETFRRVLFALGDYVGITVQSITKEKLYYDEIKKKTVTIDSLLSGHSEPYFLKFNYKVTDKFALENKRMEISKKAFPDDKVFEVFFNEDAGKIYIGEEELVNTRVDEISDDSNYRIFKYIYNHPRKRIFKKDIPTKKELTSVLDNLGFREELRKIFFPGSTKDSVLFRNPFCKKDLEEQGSKFNTIKIKDVIKKIQTKRKNRKHEMT